MNESSQWLLDYWPVISAFAVLIFWMSRTISDLKGHNDKQDEKLHQMEKKTEQLFIFWNSQIERALNKLERLEEKKED